MYGFTVVLRKKKRGVTPPEKKRTRTRTRTRSGNTFTYRPKKKIKFRKFLPLIFLAAAITVSVVFSDKNDKANSDTGADTKNPPVTEEYDDGYSFYYEPIIINNIEEFDSKESEATDNMIAAVCWSLIESDREKGEYEYFDNESVIPSKDVKKRFESLFGDEIKFENRTVEVNGCKFEYNDGGYSFPVTGMTPLYLPKLLKKEEKDGDTILTVGALKNSDYVQDEDGNTIEPEPEREYEIVLTREFNNMYISSVKIK